MPFMIRHPGEFYMDNVSFPSRLFIIYDANTEVSGLSPDVNNGQTFRIPFKHTLDCINRN